MTSTCQIWPRYISWIRIWHFQFSLYISYKTTLFNKLYCGQINSCLIFIIFKQQRWYIRKIIIMGQEFTLGSFFLIYIYIYWYIVLYEIYRENWKCLNTFFSNSLAVFRVFYRWEKNLFHHVWFFCSRFLIGSSKGHDPDFLKILVPFKYFLQL